MSKHSSVAGILVSSQSELDAAYANLARGKGGTILLAGDTDFVLNARDRHDPQTDAAVTIRSADPDNPATIRQVQLTGAEHLTVEHVQFHMDGDPDSFNDTIFLLNNCEDITVRNSTMTSDAKGPLGTADAVDAAAQLAIVRNSADITFADNVVTNFNHGFSLMDSRDVALVGNDIRALQGDGIRIAGVSGLLVEGNHIHDMLGATQNANHSDMIQIWGTRITVNNENITIRENFLDTGNGANYQMIFGYNEAWEQNGLIFQNILIEGNVLFGAHANAISLSDTHGTTVRNNTIIHNPDAYDIHEDGSVSQSRLINTIRVEGSQTTIAHNITQKALGGKANALLSTESPLLSTDFRAHFVNVETGGDGDLRDLMLRPDSPLNGVAGSWLTWATTTATDLRAVADVTLDRQDRSVFLLDASLSRGPDGYVADHGATFTWAFADGSTASGATVQHDFLTPGRHDYTLMVKMPDGTQDTITRSVTVRDPVEFNFGVKGDHVIDATRNSTTLHLQGDAEVENGWIKIGGRSRVEIARDTEELFNLNAFNLGLTVAVEEGSSGRLLQLPKTLDAEVDASGLLHVTLVTDAGRFTLVSSLPIFADDAPHSLNLRYDSAEARLALLIDDKLDAVVAAHGMTAPASSWGLTIGATWHTAVSAQIKDIYLVTEDMDLQQAAIDAELAVMPSDEPTADNSLLPPSLDVEDDTVWHTTESDMKVTLLSLDFEDDAVWAGSESDMKVVLNGPAVRLDQDKQMASRVLEIDGPSSVVAIGRTHEALYQHDDFIFSLDVRSDNADGRKVFGVHKSYQLNVADDDLIFDLTTTEGTFHVATNADVLADRGWHNVQISYSDRLDQLQIIVDGDVMATAAASGTTLKASSWGLDIGYRWGEGFEGAIDNFVLMVEPQII